MASSLVAIHFKPSDGQEWAKYIRQKLLEYNVTCDLNDLTGDFETQIHSVNVNVFFLTPDFLEYPNWNMLAVAEKQSTILVLTGIDHDELEEAATYHNCKQLLEYYIFELLNTEESVRDFLIFTIALYEDNSSSHNRLHSSHSEPTNYRHQSLVYGEEEEDLYDTLPKPRQINSIKDVIYKDGMLYLLLLRRPEGSLQVLLENQRTRAKLTEYAVYEIAHTVKGSQTISVLHDSDKIGECSIDIPKVETSDVQTSGAHGGVPTTHIRETISIGTQTDKEDVDYRDSEVDIVFSSSHDESTRESIYMNIKDVPQIDRPQSSELTCTKVRQNKLEKIRELLEDETDPLEMLCQCLGMEKDINLLDEKMTDMVRSSETLRQLSYTGKPLTVQDADTSTWPTLVHFGAQFNMLNFCEVLLSNPLMFGACLQRNKDGQTPHDIARLNGHEELAEHLRHFSEYVTAEKERDSGISGFSISAPRLSTISTHPPTPHRISDDGYIRMSKELQDEELYENEPHDSQHRKTSVSQYRVFSGSYEEVNDEDYIDMTPYHASPKTSPPVPHLQEKQRKSIKEQTVKHGTISPAGSIKHHEKQHHVVPADEEEEEVQYHRKDVVSMLGITPEQISPNEKKKTSRKIFPFLTKKSRSNSEPNIVPDVLSAFAVKRSHKKNRCESERSSGTSSSTASTYSNSSLTKEDEERNVEMRGKKKATKKMKGFLSKAKKRESMRITHAKEDKDLQAPRLPPRKKFQDTF